MIVKRRIEMDERQWKLLISILTEKRDALKAAGKDNEWPKIHDLLYPTYAAEKFFG